MRLFYCDHYDLGLPPGHRFPASKYTLLREILAQDPRFQLFPAPLATTAELERVHDAAYVQAFLSGTLPPAAMRRIGLPWSEKMVARSLASVGGTLAATQAALVDGISGALAGGTHHAARGEGSGFCVFNDIAVAIRQRAVILDLDVHQGDGTAQMFAGNDEVLTISLHGRNNFPFRKQVSDIDIAFEDNTGDDEYLAALDSILPLAFAHKPQIIYYLAGVDALREDTLGKLSLTMEGLAERDRRVLTACYDDGRPLVITMGGGYASPIELTAAAHIQTYRLAATIYKERR